MSEVRPSMPQFNMDLEQTEARRLEIFYNYLRNLGLKESDLQGKTILDIGGSNGSFGDIAARYGAQVTSVDAVRPKDWNDVLDGPSKKIYEMPAESLNIKDRLGLEEEPEFDFVLSHFSTPYVLVNEGQDELGRWKDKIAPEVRYKNLYDKTFASIQNIFLHLKAGGQAILYPLFLNLDNHDAMMVDFTHGEKRDVRELNSVVHEVLSVLQSSYQENFSVKMEEVPQKSGVNLVRLVINRTV